MVMLGFGEDLDLFHGAVSWHTYGQERMIGRAMSRISAAPWNLPCPLLSVLVTHFTSLHLDRHHASSKHAGSAVIFALSVTPTYEHATFHKANIRGATFVCIAVVIMDKETRIACSCLALLIILGYYKPRWMLAFSALSVMFISIPDEWLIIDQRPADSQPCSREGKTTQHASPLLQLPAEIRNDIYEDVASSITKIKIRNGVTLVHPLAHACRQLRSEFLPFFKDKAFPTVASTEHMALTVFDVIQYRVMYDIAGLEPGWYEMEGDGVRESFQNLLEGFLHVAWKMRNDWNFKRSFSKTFPCPFEDAIPDLLDAKTLRIEYEVYKGFDEDDDESELYGWTNNLTIVRYPEGSPCPDLIRRSSYDNDEGISVANEANIGPQNDRKKLLGSRLYEQYDDKLVKRRKLSDEAEYMETEASSNHRDLDSWLAEGGGEHWLKVNALKARSVFALLNLEARMERKANVPGAYLISAAERSG